MAKRRARKRKVLPQLPKLVPDELENAIVVDGFQRVFHDSRFPKLKFRVDKA